MHTASTYAAALTLDRRSWLAEYSKRILGVAVMLEKQLIARGVPAVQRNTNAPPTHHVWIREASKGAAFEKYEALEACRILYQFPIAALFARIQTSGSVLVPRSAWVSPTKTFPSWPNSSLKFGFWCNLCPSDKSKRVQRESWAGS